MLEGAKLLHPPFPFFYFEYIIALFVIIIQSKTIKFMKGGDAL